MAYENQLPKDKEQYMQCFRQLAAVVENAIQATESDQSGLEKNLDALMYGVEVIACMRGDVGTFSGSRPEGLSVYQKEMYEIEDGLRNHLLRLGYVYNRQ
jgi:hypothetical protein